MIKVYDYRCSKGHLFEQFQDGTAPLEWTTCDCGQPAQRQVSAPRFMLEGCSGDFPGAAMKWEQQHEKAHRDYVLSDEGRANPV